MLKKAKEKTVKESSNKARATILAAVIVLYPLRFFAHALFNELGVNLNVFLLITPLFAILVFVSAFHLKVRPAVLLLSPLLLLFSSIIVIHAPSPADATSVVLYLLIPLLVMFVHLPSIASVEYYGYIFLKVVILVSSLLVLFKLIEFSLAYGIANPLAARSNLSFIHTLEVAQQTGNNSIVDGRFMGLLLTVVYLVSNWPLWKKFAVSVPPLVFLLLIGNRQGLLGFLVLLFLLGPFRLIFKLLGAATVLVSAFALNSLANALMETELRLFAMGIGGGRMDYIPHYWTAFEDASLIGRGAGAFASEFVGTYPHNIFVETVFEQGIIAFVILLGLTVATVLSIHFNYVRLAGRPFSMFVVSSLLFYIITAQLSGNIWLNLVMFSMIVFYFALYGNTSSYMGCRCE